MPKDFEALKALYIYIIPNQNIHDFSVIILETLLFIMIFIFKACQNFLQRNVVTKKISLNIYQNNTPLM